MNYHEAVAHLYGLGPELPARQPQGSGVDAAAPMPPPRAFDLAHMRTLCAALGDPQNRVPAILIAGTNGKGSTAATLASILKAAGYRTGLYTSPHLVRVNERIQLTRPSADGMLDLLPIGDDDYARLYTWVDDTCEQLVQQGAPPHLPSFFERLTAVAFLYFAGAVKSPIQTSQNPVADIVVLEVGLGGRLDATNIVAPLLSVITDIGLDHQEYLGHTIAEITREKCGILRRDGTLITLPQTPEANQTIGLVATDLNVQAINAADYIPAPERNGAEPHGLQPYYYKITLPDPSHPGEIEVNSPLLGSHQQRNIALAIAAAVALRNNTCSNYTTSRNQISYNITNAALEAGIRSTNWPGRLELLPPNLLLDVAHNPAGAWTLRAAIASLPPEQPRTLIFSCLRDKNLTEMSRILFPLFDSSADCDPQRSYDRILLAPIPNPRASSVEDLVAAAQALGVPAEAAPNLALALERAQRVTSPNGIIIATGSVYLVGEIRRLALGLPDPLAEVVG
jgi:dihydrofolate synthase/folylpolyglutamate synthase